MAIDTRDKRLSVVGYGPPFGGPLPTPDGLVALEERRTLVGLYRGTGASSDWALRASMFNIGMPYLRPVGPVPDGTLVARDRQMAGGLYWGLAPGPPAVDTIRAHGIARALGRAIGRSF
jgi:hypothetical protein